MPRARISNAKFELGNKGLEIKNAELIKRKRLQIALGASNLLVKKGYKHATMRDICKATGLSIGNIYDYIKTKDDVLCLIFDVFHSMWSRQLEEEGVFDIKDPEEQLRVAIRKKLELINRLRPMIVLMYTESKFLPRDFLKMVLKKESSLIGSFERILRNGIEKKVFKIKDPFFAANVIVYLIAIEPLRGWNLKRKYNISEINRQLEKYIFTLVLTPELPKEKAMESRKRKVPLRRK